MGAPVSVVSLSSMPVGSLMWQRPPHAPVLTIVCRATFALRPGEATLAKEQAPLTTTERPYPDGSSRGLFAPCDLVPMKPRADVVLVGHAFAPAQQPARSLTARLVVGEMEKRVEVFGDRHFDQQGALREGPRFTSMPLVYERAAGGPETQNPIGLRPDVRDTYGRLALPNLQPTGLEIAAPTQVIAPIGFGPIPGTWPSRRALLGPTASAEARGEWQGPVVPADLDPSYFLAAPRDQQVQALRDDERIVLGNLHPQHPELCTRLPGLHPRTFVVGRGAPQGVTMRADTLWIDASRLICAVTWRGQLPLDPPGPGLRVLVALEWPDRPLAWEDVERMESDRAGAKLADAGPGAPDAGDTLVGLMTPKNPTLPFAIPPSEAHAGHDGGALQTPGLVGGLPFRRPGESAPPPLVAPPLPKEQTVDESAPFTASPATLALGGPLAPLPATVTLEDLGLAPAPPVTMGAPAPKPPAESLWARGAPPVGAPPTAAPVERLDPVPAPPAAAPATPLVRLQSAPPLAPSPRPGAVDPLHLAWFTPEIVPALRKDPRFSPLLDELEERPLDEDLDDPELAADVADLDERREVFEILARGGAVGEEGVTAALAGAVRADGRFVQPLVLVAGELAFAFDELESLKATISAAAPYAGADAEARAILDLAKEFLGSPGQPSAPAVAEGLATRIRETFEKRGLVAAGFLDAQTGRALLRGRHHQRRSLFGGPHVRALFHPGVGPGIPAYLDRGAVGELPAADRLRARLLALVHPTMDQGETHAAALRVVALAVVSAPLGRRRD